MNFLGQNFCKLTATGPYIPEEIVMNGEKGL